MRRPRPFVVRDGLGGYSISRHAAGVWVTLGATDPACKSLRRIEWKLSPDEARAVAASLQRHATAGDRGDP